MKSILVIVLFVAAAAAREHVQRMHMSPPGEEKFLNVIRAVKHGRITGGEEAVPHSIPYQVGLLITIPQVEGRFFCGGSLLNSEWVLTAAHCIWNGINRPASEMEVILGAHDIRDPEGPTRLISKTLLYHPEWRPLRVLNDIGLVKLPTPVSPSDKIQFVNLPPRSLVDETFEGYAATASGWGKTSDASETIADKLQVVTTDVISNRACNIRYPGVIQPVHMCTNTKGGKSTCAGDSGGPLTVEYEGKVIQVGVVSFGIRFGCEIGWPAAFARTTPYLDWISEVAGLAIN